METQLVQPNHPCDFHKRNKSMDAFTKDVPVVWRRREIYTYTKIGGGAKEGGSSAINNIWINPMSDANGGIRGNRFPMSISMLN